jgi:predicted transposase/invertase (TIGR01784 family)
LEKALEVALKQVREDAWKEGFIEGRKQGWKEGQLEARTEIATRALRMGWPIEEVVEVTGLSTAKVRALKKKL